MATTTRVLTASVNGTVYTSNANGALEALDTCHSGPTAPTDEVANGKLWLDTTTTPGILKMYDNATWNVVVNATNVTAAGALMDGELTFPDAVKALDQGVATTDSPTFAALTATGTFTSQGIDDNAISTAMTLDNSGHAIIPAGVTLGTAAGVYNAANTLDDYETGTWTPAFEISDGCFSSVTSISGVSGKYTKVGNQVIAWYKFEVDQSITNAEGILRIDGLPFTSSFTNYGSGGAQLYVSHGDKNSEVASAGISNTTVYVYRGTVNGTTGTPNIQGFVTYQTGS